MHSQRRPFPSSPANPAHTFDTFVVSRASERAFAAAIDVAENRGQAPNPLFLRGKTGSGKTHLLDAIHHAIQSREPEAEILHVSAEALTRELVDAVRTDQMVAFRDDMARFDVILLDDVRLDDKPRTYEEIRRSIDDAVSRSARVIVASDVEFKRSPFLLGYPDVRARREIARRAAARYGIDLTHDAVRSIARRITGSPRIIQSALARMAAELRIVA
jgi:chromosomal replication initiator protein